MVSISPENWHDCQQLWLKLHEEVQKLDQNSSLVSHFKQLDSKLFSDDSKIVKASSSSLTINFNDPNIDIDKYLDEIANDVKDDNYYDKNVSSKNDEKVVKIFSKLQRKTKEFIQEPFSNIDMNLELSKQWQYWSQFARHNDGYHKYPKSYYNCSELDSNNFEIKWNLSHLWNDFVNIKQKLFENDLMKLLISTPECDNNDITFLFNNIEFKRNECGLLPTKYDIFSKFKLYKRFVLYFNDVKKHELNTELHPILKYFYIWNGIFAIFSKLDNVSDTYGIDGILSGNNSNNNDIKSFEKDCCDHFLTQIANSVVFNMNDSNTSKINKCKNVFFNNEISVLEELIKYCMQDVSSLRAYKENRIDCNGIKYFIVNRMAFVIFNDLSQINKLC